MHALCSDEDHLSLAPGVYLRCLLVGNFEGIDSDLQVHHGVFTWVLAKLAGNGVLEGETLGVADE